MELRPGYKRTEVGVIPEEWEVKPLSDLSAFITKGSTPTTYGFKWEQDGILFLRSECVGENGLDLNQSMFISPAAHEMLRRSEARDGDLLITITGHVGRIVELTGVGLANLNQHIARVRITEPSVVAPFVFHYLSQRVVRRHFETITTGQAYPQISLQQVRAAEVPVPPLPEQRAIATALSDVDVLLTQLDRLIAKKRDIKQAAMQQLLTGKTRLPGFGGAWRSGTVGDVVEALEAGVSVNSMDDPPTPGAPSVLKTSAVSAGRFLPEECKRITAADIPRARTNPLANTILISRMNTPDLVGEVAYVPVDHRWLFLPDRLWMTRFKPSARVDARWLAYLLSSRAYQQQIKAAATGTSGSMKNISKDSLLSIPVPFPEHEEQTAIATLLSDLDTELAALEARRDKTRALKQGMIQELLTGRTRLV